MSLFEPEILYLTGRPATPKLSPGAARTRRNNEHLAAGIHPATLHRLAPDSGTCGNCRHHFASGWSAHTHHKCDVHVLGVTHGPATDIRVGWPACDLFEGREP